MDKQTVVLDQPQSLTNDLYFKAQSPPSKDQWEQQRLNIKALYLDQGLTLKAVMAGMKERYGFHATEKMYKTRISEWRLDQKHKKFKKTRNGGAISKSLHGKAQSEHHGSLSGVVAHCRARSIPAFNRANEAGRSEPAKTRALSPSLATRLQGPKDLENLDEILFSIRSYFQGHLDAGTWTFRTDTKRWENTKQRKGSRALDNLFFNSRAALNFFNSERYSQGGKLLTAAFATIGDIIRDENQRFLRDLLILISSFRSGKRPELSIMLVKQCCLMTKELHGTHHPLYRSLFKLYTLEEISIDASLCRLRWCLANLIAKLSGTFHYEALLYRLDYIVWPSNGLSPQDQERQIRTLLENERSRPQPFHTNRMGNIWSSLGPVLRKQGRLAEAAHALETSLEFRPYGSGDIMAHLAAIRLHMGMTDLAIDTLREVVADGIAKSGPHDGKVLQYSNLLETWCAATGREEDVLEVKSAREAAMRELDAVTL